ncbi:cytochrome P450 18a1-like [Stegodyphus dumicola]|uniref:cytochrome P450 18a1-like n=1 Tax=Stegodyphus dumicola TaxID=202533 RepID=UPI0015A9E52B|nr:cytochrome P450 18a1-like [Stegodyphus dumicola]
MEYLKDLNVTPILIGILLSVATLYWWCSRRSYKLPPGPVGLPLVGYLPFLDKESFKSFKKLTEKYGNIFSLYLGRNFTVVLNDYKLIKEAFNQQALLDRPPHIFDFHPDGFGFVGTNGEEWTDQRRYTMKIMRDIGLGKSQWENLLMLKTHDGKPVNIYRFLSASVSNNMTTLVFGKRLPAGDPARILVDKNVEVSARVFLQSGFVSFFPKLLSLIAKIRFTQLGKDRKFLVQFSSFLKRQIESRKKALMVEDSEDVFIDGYLKEIEKNKQRHIKNTFNEKNLIGSCQAMVSAGSETTRTAILWLLLAMVTYPVVQKKVHEELDTVLRKDGKITWKERSKLPYVSATIMESLRWKTVAPLNILH